MDLRMRDEYIKNEKIDGVIHDMSPAADFKHSLINNNINSVIKAGLKGSICRVFIEHLDYFYSKDSDDYVRPDIMICCYRNKIKGNGYYGVPKFIAETLSPSTARRDRGRKMEIYASSGVSEYWIISPKEEAIEVYYLKDGKYELETAYILDRDEKSESYNAKTELALREFPLIKMSLEEIFEGWEE
ncbi:MAG: Uma2 family endonuclease [Lachnospiraceae bacterium]|nr:Uma2 family endonuclease [Lachnospiraceae bacterium]